MAAKGKLNLIDEANEFRPLTPEKAINDLIIKLCNDVTEGRTRDEFKTLDAIASLYNAVR